MDILLGRSMKSIEVRNTPRLRPVDVPLLIGDISQLRAPHTGWEPVIDVASALEHTLNYWRVVVTRRV